MFPACRLRTCPRSHLSLQASILRIHLCRLCQLASSRWFQVCLRVLPLSHPKSHRPRLSHPKFHRPRLSHLDSLAIVQVFLHGPLSNLRSRLVYPGNHHGFLRAHRSLLSLRACRLMCLPYHLVLQFRCQPIRLYLISLQVSRV